ncbi:MAG: GNAT family N-acetyltransferase [Desulfuromonadaceae bacterium]|nr:GNAT family N-acetyltransferase [Desulfuromonas sp.]MDY0185429.1 GNAT family N-acetyltransferase [Desulfuromonadaceae bacterium]
MKNLLSALKLPARLEALPLAQGFGRNLALLADFDANRCNAVMLACEEAFSSIVERADQSSAEPIQVQGEVTPLELTLCFSDKEMPPMSDDEQLPRLDTDQLDDADLSGLGRVLIRGVADGALWESLGRDGNRLHLTFNRQHQTMTAPPELGTAQISPSSAAKPQEYRIRCAGSNSDWPQITRIAFHAYGYTHPSNDLYSPERLRELNHAGRLISVVATAENEQVVGHYALEVGGLGQVAASKPLVAETGMAVVHPDHRGQGLMERMRHFLESAASKHGLLGIFSQPVTSHPFSQQVNEKFSGHPCALSLAFLAPSLKFRAMTQEQSGQRESCLFYFKTLTTPAPRLLHLPTRYRDILLETYQRCEIPVTEADTPSAMTEISHVSAHYLSALDLGMIRVETVGQDILAALRTSRNELCRKAGARVVYLTVRLTRPGAEEACSAAERIGFFYGGLAPCFDEGEDVIRLQYLDITLDSTRLTVTSPFAKRLLAYIESDRLRIENL